VKKFRALAAVALLAVPVGCNKEATKPDPPKNTAPVGDQINKSGRTMPMPPPIEKVTPP
jgi:hypothetical protein